MSRLLWIEYEDVAIGAPPKVGSSTVNKSLEIVDHIKTRTPTAKRKVFLTRNPIDRFLSVYQQKVVEGGKIAGLGYGMGGMSLDHFFDFTLACDNYHWTPQVELLDGVEAQLVPLILLDSWWPRNMSVPLAPRQNVSREQKFEVSDELYNRIRDRYQADIELHSRSLGNYRA